MAALCLITPHIFSSLPNKTKSNNKKTQNKKPYQIIPTSYGKHQILETKPIPETNGDRSGMCDQKWPTLIEAFLLYRIM